MNLSKNQKVRWTINDEQGETVSYYGTVSLVKNNMVTFYVDNVGSMTVPVNDGRFEVVEQLQSNLTEVKEKTVTIKRVERVVASNGMRKSDQVRYRISIAKQNNEEQDQVIDWAIANLGMARSLAKTYVNNNWNKV